MNNNDIENRINTHTDNISNVENDIDINEKILNNFKYHAFCARATLYPGKSIDEVLEILNNLNTETEINNLT